MKYTRVDDARTPAVGADAEATLEEIFARPPGPMLCAFNPEALPGLRVTPATFASGNVRANLVEAAHAVVVPITIEKLTPTGCEKARVELLERLAACPFQLACYSVPEHGGMCHPGGRTSICFFSCYLVVPLARSVPAEMLGDLRQVVARDLVTRYFAGCGAGGIRPAHMSIQPPHGSQSRPLYFVRSEGPLFDPMTVIESLRESARVAALRAELASIAARVAADVARSAELQAQIGGAQ